MDEATYASAGAPQPDRAKPTLRLAHVEPNRDHTPMKVGRKERVDDRQPTATRVERRLAAGQTRSRS